MFELNAMGNYVLTMTICLVFIMVLLARQKRTGKDVAVWLFAGIVGIMLGIGGTLAAINLTNHQIVEKYEMVQPVSAEDEEEGDSGGGGGRGGGGGGGRGGGRGGFDPAARFAELDADGDGKLTGDEISERMAENLEETDTDGDGSVTLEEFQTRMQSRGGGRGRGAGGDGGPSGGDGGDQGDSGGEAGAEAPDRPQRPETEE